MLRSQTHLGFECLERRQMLSGLGVAPGLSVAAMHASDQSHVPVLIASRLTGHSNAQLTVLNGTLGDPTNANLSGSVHYMDLTVHGNSRTMFTANIRGAAADTTYNVAIDGTPVGQIKTDANGSGRLLLSSDPHGRQLPLPDDFPESIAAGSTVTIGSATATLNGKRGLGEHAVTRLTATLRDPANSAVTGQVKFFSAPIGGGTNAELFIATVRGAQANSTLNVMINGTSIGTIRTNSAGVGTLVLSSQASTFPINFPTTVSAGDTVMVGTASGTLGLAGA
jgi:hypothetical protein